MNDQELLNEAKIAIKTVMMDYIFEPLNDYTTKCIVSELATSLSEVIDMDFDFNVTANIVDDDMEVIIYIQGVGEFGSTKLTAKYTDCPALSEEALMLNKEEKRAITPKVIDKTSAAVLFDIAMEVVDG